MIRPAKAADIARLVEIWKDAHARSKYARATFDTKEAQKRLFNCIRAHGAKHEGGTWCMVAETKGQVEGFLFGLTDRLEDVGVELFASDWKWLVTKDADVRDTIALRDSFIGWAKANPRVVEIVVGVHDALGADFRRTATLWTHVGFKEIGMILSLSIERPEPARSVA